MRKLISTILALSLVTAALIGCTPTDTSAGTPVADKNITEYTTQGKETKLVGDPNATGELYISQSAGGEMGNNVKTAVEKFKELYPNVKLTFEQVKFEEYDDQIDYFEKLKTEVMAGKGPDIFWLNRNMDMYKMMQSGKFADLTPFFEADKNFNIKDYNEAIFYGLQYNGKQYVVPYGYTIPTFLTTKSIVDDKLVDTQKFNGYLSTIDEAIRIIKKDCQNKERDIPIIDVNNLNMYMTFSGLADFNYEKSLLNYNENDLKNTFSKQKELVEAMSLLKPSPIQTKIGYTSADLLINKQSLLNLDFSNFYAMINNGRYLSAKDEPIILPMSNIRGNVTASIDPCIVNDACKNKQNAYNFLKVLISPEVQGYMDANTDYTDLFNSIRHNQIPISNQAKDKILDLMKNPLASDPEAVGLSQKFIDDFESIIEKIDSIAYEYNNIMTYDEMKPYLEGKKSYDECMQSLQAKLEIYIAE